VREEAIAAAAETMRSGWVGMGPKVAAFEQAFAASLGAAHALAVNTGTAALHLAVRALGLPRGAEVVTTPVTFVATNEVLLWEGLTPVFADVDPLTGLIDPASVAEKLGEGTGALMVVHFGGLACDMSRLQRLADERRIPVIEDCAHACGALIGERRIGSSGNLCAFSFGPTKALTTIDGGMLITRDGEQLERLRRLRNMGMSKEAFRRVAEGDKGGKAQPFWDYDVENIGFRYHMNDVDAAMGLAHLAALDEDNRAREVLAARYDELLENIPGIQVVTRRAGSSHYLYWVMAERRDELAEALRQRGVTTGVYYKPNTMYPIFASADLPGAQAFFARQLSLPLYPDLSREEQDFVIDAIRKGW
jgi:perosamine synthetase